MVELYCTLIINKRRKYSDIPEKFKASVEKRLYELDYDTNGDPLPKEA